MRPGPLARFLPPLEEGAVEGVLSGVGAPGDLVLDPFGVSPRLATDAARAGRAVIVACNNPVTRFVLERTARPFAPGDLRTALARVAAAPKDGTRLELFLLDLYRTECARCGGAVTADHFVWDRDAQRLTLKGYVCPACNHAGEDPATAADQERVLAMSRRGLQHALALEQVAPAGDPDREHAEAALAVYPGRALFALITLVNKLTTLPLEPPLDAAARALLLSACDAANALWGHPETRHRPRQLIASPRFREVNVWRAMERAVEEWTLVDPPVPLASWTAEGDLRPGSIAVFAGTGRELIAGLPRGSIRQVVSVPPRPNQAYWTLSALWAAWLWGREAAAPIKVALRRRRYDWAWHSGALRTSVAGLSAVLAAEAPVVAIVPEAEPGFVAALLAGWDAAGFGITGRALRPLDGQALLRWHAAPGEAPGLTGAEAVQRMATAAAEALRARGEPAPYAVVHAAAWSALAAERRLAGLWRAEEARATTLLNEALEKVLADGMRFVRYGAGAEAEVGLYWLRDESRSAPPLADRVEMVVLQTLREAGLLTEPEVERAVCTALPGLLTPDRRLVQACLRSYGQLDEASGRWSVRPEDRAEARRQDIAEVARLLREVGSRLGFTVDEGEVIRWRADGHQASAFRVRETATLGDALAGPKDVVYVLPGGRGLLVAEKARRDPRLKAWLESDVRVVKYRHVRRLAADTTLRRENLAERIALDPMDEMDPQLPLL